MNFFSKCNIFPLSGWNLASIWAWTFLYHTRNPGLSAHINCCWLRNKYPRGELALAGTEPVSFSYSAWLGSGRGVLGKGEMTAQRLQTSVIAESCHIIFCVGWMSFEGTTSIIYADWGHWRSVPGRRDAWSIMRVDYARLPHRLGWKLGAPAGCENLANYRV